MGSKRKLITYIILLLVSAGIFTFFYYFRAKVYKIISPVFMAIIIAYLLHPIVIKLEHKKIKRTVGILLIYLLFSLALIAVMIFVLPEIVNNVRELIVSIPELTTRYQNLLNNIISAIQSSDWSPDIKNTLFREIENVLSAVQTIAVDTLKVSLVKLIGTVTAMFDIILAMIIAYYFVKDAEFFKETFLSFSPRKWRNGLIGAGREINVILSNFIQGQLLTALIVGTMDMIGLYIVKVKYPLILGLVGGAANIIPYFGPILGAIPAVAIALIESPAKALWTALVFTIIQQIDNAFISPKIIEGKLGLHPVTTIVAVLIGGEFAGIIGMLVAVPIAAVIKVILKRAVEAIV